MSSVVAVGGEKFGEIALRADGFGEDHGLALSALRDDVVEHAGQRFDELVALGVFADGKRELAVSLQLGDFGFELFGVDRRLVLRVAVLGVVKLLGVLVDHVVVSDGLDGRRLHRLEALDDLGERVGDGEGRRAENLAHDHRDKLVRLVAEGDRVLALQIGGHVGVELYSRLPTARIPS